MRSRKRASLAYAAILVATAGCSTVETRRADPATFEGSTARSTAEIETCLSDGFDRVHLLPNFRPTATGGSYVLAEQGYVQWVIDVRDETTRRTIVVHAITTMWGRNDKLVGIVQGCL